MRNTIAKQLRKLVSPDFPLEPPARRLYRRLKDSYRKVPKRDRRAFLGMVAETLQAQ